MVENRLFGVAAALLCMLSCVHAWYIPGVSPVSYTVGKPVGISVNSLTSPTNLVPYPFYMLKTCTPSKELRKQYAKTENLGEILWGDQIEPSLFRAEVRVNVTCRILCAAISYSDVEIGLWKKHIEQHYRGNLILDNLPVAQELPSTPLHPRVSIGYPLGLPKQLHPDKRTTLIYNHLHFTIGIHRPADAAPGEEIYRIVGFYVVPYSINHAADGSTCKEDSPFAAEDQQPLTTEASTILWTYGISWREEPNIQWSSRWYVYLSSADGENKIHWYSIINSLLILLFLTGMVFLILIRALKKDFAQYDQKDNQDEAQEETGWKLVHADVFRHPEHSTLLAINIGSGVQLIGMAFITLIFALLGFLSPANRGGLLTAGILLFVLLGCYNGYVTARMLKYFNQQNWWNIFMSALYYPGIMFGAYFCVNLVQWYKHASSAVPFTTLLVLMGLWMCISLPLVLFGAVLGYKQPDITIPCKINPLARAIPPQKWFLRPPFTIITAGMLPFGAAFMELVFILSSIWQGRLYYVFGFLALVMIIVVITCAEITIVMVYFQLCYEDFRWWWRSFFMAGSAGLHLFLYSAYYHLSLNITQWSSSLIYFGYMGMASLSFGLFCGTVGFLASFYFVRTIYAYIKIE